MQDNSNYSYISTVITPDNSTHYIKDAEARTAITSLETSKQDVIDSTHKLPASNVSGLATVATSGDYDDLLNKPIIPEGATVDDAMSSTSTNPVQNKAIKAYVDNQISGLGAILNYKGTKSSYQQIIGITSAKAGDVWINTADNSEYVCKQDISVATASAWEQLGQTIDLSAYALTADLGDLAYKDDASATYTPAGSVSINSYTPAGTISVGSGTANYTPAGTVSTPTITVTPTTTTVNSITSVGSLPSWSASVSSETLSFSWNQGALPTKGSDTTVATGISSASSSQPSFTGTGAELKFTGTSVTPTGSFSGTEATITVS